MSPQPTLTTDRLILRPFRVADAPDVQRLAGEYEVAYNTLTIPHPYPEGAAEEWIALSAAQFEEGKQVNFAIELRESGALVGSIGLVLTRQHDRGEIGYWVAPEHWNRGYASEAAQAIVDYGFEELALNRIDAGHFDRNPSSGRVMEKVGMLREGHLRQAIKKWDLYVDIVFYAILRSEWEALKKR
jgi:ribosomal-protein-alanine N-acetyltransferase